MVFKSNSNWVEIVSKLKSYPIDVTVSNKVAAFVKFAVEV